MNDFDWGEYVDLAEELLASPLDASNKAQLRAAVSRAYYGASPRTA